MRLDDAISLSSFNDLTGRRLIAVMMSPARNPRCAAGLPGSTELTSTPSSPVVEASANWAPTRPGLGLRGPRGPDRRTTEGIALAAQVRYPVPHPTDFILGRLDQFRRMP